VNIEGGDESYAETLARIAALMDAERFDRERIADLSTQSAREYLNEALIKISQALGLAVARVAALMADVLAMTKNAGKAFSTAFHENYERSRRIKPFEG
jgi:hypothetical protein